MREAHRTRGWVLELDIKAFFDHVNHDLIIKVLKHHQMPDWVILYCTRWLKAPMIKPGQKTMPETRVLISPLLANLFLHYAFDCWLEREEEFYVFGI